MVRKSQYGFTLVEVVLSVAIVAVGLVFILQAIGKEINVVSIADDKIETALFLRQKTNEVEKELIAIKEIAPISQTGETVNNGKSYQWALSVSQDKQFENLYEIKTVCSWQKFGRERTNTLETCFCKVDKAEDEE